MGLTVEGLRAQLPDFQVWLLRQLPRSLGAIGLFVGFWIAGVIVHRAVARVGRRRGLDLDLTGLLSRLARLTLVAFGAITAIGTFGIDIKALVAGLGLTGFALGFALKDIISNSLAGVLILSYKPFRRGDHIEVAGSAGRVQAIDLRYTILLAHDGSKILVPNSNLFTNSIRVAAGESPDPKAPIPVAPAAPH